MTSFEKKEQNLNQLIDKLNSMSLSYSQPSHELEKIKTEKRELVNKKKGELDKKNNEIKNKYKEISKQINNKTFIFNKESKENGTPIWLFLFPSVR